MRFYNRHIADKLFYSIIGLLVIVIGGLGSIIIYQRIQDVNKKTERRIEIATHYLEKVLPQDVRRLDAKQMRKDIEECSSDELEIVEIFDADNERIYIYEGFDNDTTYDKVIERDLFSNGKKVGMMKAYFSIGSYMDTFRLKEFLRLIIIMCSAGLALGGGLYFLVERIIIKPMNKILVFSKDLADGNYDRRIKITSQDEIGMLQNALNKMGDSLQDFVEDLQTSFCAAETARQQAQESSRLKSIFLANMSHEIRTPINAIVGFSDVLLDNVRDTEEKEILTTIKQSANILLENINDILEFSKLEAGKLKISTEDFLIKELIDEIRPIVKLRLHDRAVDFETNISRELGSIVHGDRIRIRQVLLNILINATKFTHAGKIVLTIMPNENGILFKVEDTGIGINEENFEKIFEPFIQADGTITREYGGAGLGLSIAKALVEMMGGRIWLESTQGKGSTFYFTVTQKV